MSAIVSVGTAVINGFPRDNVRYRTSGIVELVSRFQRRSSCYCVRVVSVGFRVRRMCVRPLLLCAYRFPCEDTFIYDQHTLKEQNRFVQLGDVSRQLEQCKVSDARTLVSQRQDMIGPILFLLRAK